MPIRGFPFVIPTPFRHAGAAAYRGIASRIRGDRFPQDEGALSAFVGKRARRTGASSLDVILPAQVGPAPLGPVVCTVAFHPGRQSNVAIALRSDVGG